MFAETEALPASVRVQLLVVCPPLEQAPLQIALRPLETVSVMDELVVKDADPLLPDATLMPDGAEVMRSPERPLAVTERVAVCIAGVRVSTVVAVIPPAAAVMVTGVEVVTAVVLIVKSTVLEPAGTVTLAGTIAEALLLVIDTGNGAGAGPVRITTACDGEPPVTLAGNTLIACRLCGGGGAVNVRLAVFETLL
jgi:hypothetical protein